MMKWKFLALTTLLLAPMAFANGNGTSFSCEFQQLDPGDIARVIASEEGEFKIDASGYSTGLRLVVDGNEASLYTVPSRDIVIVLQPVGSSAERGFVANLPRELAALPEFGYSIFGPIKEGHSQDFRLVCHASNTR